METSASQSRRTIATVLGTICVSLLLLTIARFLEGTNEIYLGSVAIVSLLGLLLAYFRGFELARPLAVVVVSLVFGFMLPAPDAPGLIAIMVLVPPIAALVLVGPKAVILSGLAMLAIMLYRFGWATFLTQPSFLVLYALVIAGLILNHRLISSARQAAEVSARQTKELLQRSEEQTNELANQRNAMRESEMRYRIIAENSNDLVFLMDEERRFAYVSPSFEPVMGYPPAQLMGTSPFALVHPEDLDVMQSAWKRALVVNKADAICRVKHASGTFRWMEVQATHIRQGNTRAFLITARDVTERKRLEAQLFQSQKMESIGRLAGGIAHDFNNLLTAMTGYTDLALMALEDNHPVQNDLNEISKAVDRAANLTRQLLAFARRQVVETRHINLNLLLQDVDRLLRRLLGEDIELVIQAAPGLGLVNADAGQLEQVMVNLVVNARDAMPNGGRLVIETQNVELDDTFAFDHSGVNPGPYVMLAITDTGTGMPEEVKQHIFEPFFTTKEPGAGTGLGLATCYGIVSQSKGSIWVYSEVGLGTTFKVYLPRIEGIADELPQRVEPFGFARGSERVLVVEDAPTVRALAVRVLRDQGYQVVEAQDGAEALRVLYATATPFDLLLTDVVMPKMGGKALAEQVHTRYPHTKILFTSGYTDEAMGRNGQLDEARAFLQKPFTPAALTQKVRDVLDGG